MPESDALMDNERIRSFVSHLLRLASSDDPSKTDRAALADLRSGLRRNPGDLYPPTMARMARHIGSLVGEDWNPQSAYDDRHWYFVVAALLASHPDQVKGESRSFGISYAAIAGDSGSIEARFTQLLGSRTDRLPDYLRQAISLLEAKHEPVDYYQLLRDCLRWDVPGRPVQLKWARDFYVTQEKNKTKETGDLPATNETP